MLSALLADLRRYEGRGLPRLLHALNRPGFWAVAAFRIMNGTRALPRWLGAPLRLLLRPPHLLLQLLTGIELQPGARIGPGLYIGHWGGIVVSHRATLGAQCNLSQGVTIGEADGPSARGAPTIGDRVYFAPGSKVFGPILIGSDVAIGANAVVNRDVPSGVSVGGVPAKIISERGSVGLIAAGDAVEKNVVRG